MAEPMPQPSDAIQVALHQIRQHPHVVDVGALERIGEKWRCLVQVRINLPAQWRSQGQSPNGVRAVEEVEFHFPDNYPFNPPDIRLRSDFDRRLPHIHPGKEGEAVRPCYLEGNPRELLHQSGILTLVNQIVDWLDKTASGELIDYRQGWEPIRRDSSTDILIADISALQALIKHREGQVHFRMRYQRFVEKNPLIPGKWDSAVYGELHPEPLSITVEAIQKYTLFQEQSYGASTYRQGFSIAVLAFSDKTHIVSEYQPDTVQTLEDLCARATDYGCRGPLEAALKHLQEFRFHPSETALPLILLLCARRPTHLIGSNSSLEIIAYKVESALPLFQGSWNAIPVQPVSLLYSINPVLLRQVSGLPPTFTPLKAILLGCGSLGSKQALHLARAGAAPQAVVDNDYFMPHNAARHGLTNFESIDRKSDALADAIQALGQKTESHYQDVISLMNSEKDWRNLTKGLDMILNSTASLAVRNALSALPNKKLSTRVIESILFSRGAAGVMTLEGEKRNPNTSDVMLEIYEYARHHASLRQALFADNALGRQAVGQGCGTMTMPMPDTDISMYAASMSGKLLEFHQTGLPNGARFWIGLKSDDNMSLNWITSDVMLPYTIIQADNDPRWTIRLSSRTSAKILANCQLYPNVETGGIVVGAVSEARGAITIVDVLPAPEDSKRTAMEFTLGTQGVKTMLKEYGESSNYALLCVGTWHSHLINVGASQQDYQTAAAIADSTPEISTLLIRTPKGFRAIVASRLHTARRLPNS